MKITVLGAGCWGLTLAKLMTPNFDRVCVWGRNQDLSDELIQEKKRLSLLRFSLLHIPK